MTEITRLINNFSLRMNSAIVLHLDSLFVKLKNLEVLIEVLDKVKRANSAQADHIELLQDRMDQLEQRLQQPKLCSAGENDKNYTEGLNDGITQSAIYLRCQDFTVKEKLGG